METATTSNTTNIEHGKLSAVSLCLATAILGWTLWVVLMALAPAIFANDLLRAFARVLLVLIPALVYIQRVEQVPIVDYLLMRQNVRWGVFVGVAASVVVAALIVAQSGNVKTITLPAFSVWINAIFGSPFAEEILFRGVALQYFARRYGAWRAVLISSVLFVVLHLPVWLILDRLGTQRLITSSIYVFVYGVVFALLFLRSRSFWSSFIPHIINNLLVSIL
jgi:uncharacterized protein